jgi:hypothetical protein
MFKLCTKHDTNDTLQRELQAPADSPDTKYKYVTLILFVALGIYLNIFANYFGHYVN